MRTLEFNTKELDLLMKSITMMQSHHMAQKSHAENIIKQIKSKWEDNSVTELQKGVEYHTEQSEGYYALWKKLS